MCGGKKPAIPQTGYTFRKVGLENALLGIVAVLLAAIGAAVWLLLRQKDLLVSATEARIRAEADLAAERRSAEERKEALAEAESRFEALAAKALQENQISFLDLAKRELGQASKDAAKGFEKETGEVKKLVEPLQKSLESLEKQAEEMERGRRQMVGQIHERLESVVKANAEVALQAAGLKDALKRPHVRGRWGEVQLRNCVELAGMDGYCDFHLQESTRTEDELVRPDMTVRMPGGRKVVVDAKAPTTGFDSYIDAQTDEERNASLIQHGKALKGHVDDLARKEYWEKVAESPDFVAMFLPNESFLYAALETQRDLMEYAMQKKVLIVSPPNLIALLKVVRYGWNEQKLAEDASKIAEEGREFHKRIAEFLTNYEALGKALEKAQREYYAGGHNLNHKVVVTARRLEALGAKSPKTVREVAVAALPGEGEEVEPRELFGSEKPESDGVIEDAAEKS